jgi:hypothetical protein
MCLVECRLLALRIPSGWSTATAQVVSADTEMTVRQQQRPADANSFLP